MKESGFLNNSQLRNSGITSRAEFGFDKLRSD